MSCLVAALSAVVLFALRLLLRTNVLPPKRQIDTSAEPNSRPGIAKMMAKEAPRTGLSYLVVGTGSVGLSILDALAARGEKKLKGFDVAPPTRQKGFDFVQGDVTDFDALCAALRGVDVVYATFALIRFMERLDWMYTDSHRVNVLGTQTLVRACIACDVRVLVQTSTSNVCVGRDVTEKPPMDESSPLVGPTTSPNHYGWSKVQAEHAVLNANGSAGATKGLLGARRTLATGAIRPCSGIFGPEDRFMTQRWLDAGQTDIIIPWVTIDYIYVENVVWGHLLLEKALLDRPAKCGGQAFCVTNGEPVMGQDFHKALAYWCERVTGRKHLVKNLPYAPIAAMCYVVEAFERLTRTRVGGDVGNLTPAMLATATVSYTFSHAKAARELGYEPLYTLDEALHRTVRQWRDFKAARDAQ